MLFLVFDKDNVMMNICNTAIEAERCCPTMYYSVITMNQWEMPIEANRYYPKINLAQKNKKEICMELKNGLVWIAGRSDFDFDGKWTVLGAFSSEYEAFLACTYEEDFIGCLTVNTKIEETDEEWPGSYRPLCLLADLVAGIVDYQDMSQDQKDVIAYLEKISHKKTQIMEDVGSMSPIKDFLDE